MYHQCKCGCGIEFHTQPSSVEHAKAVLALEQERAVVNILRQSYYHTREYVHFREIASTIVQRWEQLKTTLS